MVDNPALIPQGGVLGAEDSRGTRPRFPCLEDYASLDREPKEVGQPAPRIGITSHSEARIHSKPIFRPDRHKGVANDGGAASFVLCSQGARM
jgi:hypothetical protein